jgi:hypothetical protein
MKHWKTYNAVLKGFGYSQALDSLQPKVTFMGLLSPPKGRGFFASKHKLYHQGPGQVGDLRPAGQASIAWV